MQLLLHTNMKFLRKIYKLFRKKPVTNSKAKAFDLTDIDQWFI